MRVGAFSLTPPAFLVIVRRFRKNASGRVSYRRRRLSNQPAGLLAWVECQVGAISHWTCPQNRSLLAEGRGKSHRSPRVLHLGGLCGPETRNGAGFPFNFGRNARPPSRFSSEIGTKADAKQQLWAFVRVWQVVLPRQNATRSPMWLFAPDKQGMPAFGLAVLRSKEFRFAYF
jgi:hypothetical protein